tara:strand:+ start:6773 stop:7246 length:474 start_codon:yes stop_codon:yes gene_type:complete
MRDINKIIVHCSATYPDQNAGVDTIRKWHVEERGWDDIGYHYVIRRDGTVEEGRPIIKAGAHCRGQNKNSVGVCLEGGLERVGSPNDTLYTTEPSNDYTPVQLKSLGKLILTLRTKYGTKDKIVELYGHNEFDSHKTCPNFDVIIWFTMDVIKDFVR